MAKYTKEQKAAIRHMYNAGKSDQTIAEKLVSMGRKDATAKHVTSMRAYYKLTNGRKRMKRKSLRTSAKKAAQPHVNSTGSVRLVMRQEGFQGVAFDISPNTARVILEMLVGI